MTESTPCTTSTTPSAAPVQPTTPVYVNTTVPVPTSQQSSAAPVNTTAQPPVYQPSASTSAKPAVQSTAGAASIVVGGATIGVGALLAVLFV